VTVYDSYALSLGTVTLNAMCKLRSRGFGAQYYRYRDTLVHISKVHISR
jgi:hypothetical protein